MQYKALAEEESELFITWVGGGVGALEMAMTLSSEWKVSEDVFENKRSKFFRRSRYIYLSGIVPRATVSIRILFILSTFSRRRVNKEIIPAGCKPYCDTAVNLVRNSCSL